MDLEFIIPPKGIGMRDHITKIHAMAQGFIIGLMD